MHVVAGCDHGGPLSHLFHYIGLETERESRAPQVWKEIAKS